MKTDTDHGNHHHDAIRCWWNWHQAHWVCPAGITEYSAGQANSVAHDAGRPLVDVRDMIVVHTALLREFRLAPRAVEQVKMGDRRRSIMVGRHLRFLIDLLHHHHAGEDALLWPILRARVSTAATPSIERVEAQHVGIDLALGGVRENLLPWMQQPSTGNRDRLAGSLRHLHALLEEHLDLEERAVLPLAAAVLTDAEWRAIGEAGVAEIPKQMLPLVFGMFAYEGDPVVLRQMLETAPAMPRTVLPLIAPRVYARRARRIHGTTRP